MYAANVKNVYLSGELLVRSLKMDFIIELIINNAFAIGGGIITTAATLWWKRIIRKSYLGNIWSLTFFITIIIYCLIYLEIQTLRKIQTDKNTVEMYEIADSVSKSILINSSIHFDSIQDSIWIGNRFSKQFIEGHNLGYEKINSKINDRIDKNLRNMDVLGNLFIFFTVILILLFCIPERKLENEDK